MTTKPKVALIGAGAMGAALLKGWIAKDALDAGGSAVFDPAISAAAAAEIARAAGLALNPAIEARFDVVVLAIKPQMLGEASRYAPMAKSALVLSVLAGKSIASISAVLGTKRVVRAMPNLPAMMGAGAAGLCSPPEISAEDRRVAQALMEAVGVALFVDDEAAIDAVTAISGSGPAYFFLMAEALEDAARSLGLSGETARALARQTLIGAGAVLEEDARGVAVLRRAVASPGGTTEAALGVLDGDGEKLRKLMKAAAQAAFARARALAS
ncbi:MAG TPA: pyrroline-5-carboxylate reductase [Parvularcula sp.]|nr:pyrroline-5-carboxylate reductase [Parvularcula sp.]HBS36502.1 pyrroline-5-carboxylate reductase [Parvularcula sp.]